MRSLIVAAVGLMFNCSLVFAQSSGGVGTTGAVGTVPPSTLPSLGLGGSTAVGSATTSVGPSGIPLGATELNMPGESPVTSASQTGGVSSLLGAQPGIRQPSPFSALIGSSASATGIPLGAMGIANGGVSPSLNPSSLSSTGGCTGAGGGLIYRTGSYPLFDGGGLNHVKPYSALATGCGQTTPSGGTGYRPASGRAGIPLGATELTNPGLGPTPQLMLPNP
jgi:hypothetical protein